MYIRDVDIETDYSDGELATQINNASYAIEGLYLTCLGRNRMYAGNFWKAIVRLSTEAEVELDDMVDVIAINRLFDFPDYLMKEKQEKKKILLDNLHAGLLDIAYQKGWDIIPLVNAYNCCLAKDIEHTYWIKNKVFRSPGRQYYAGVYCDYDIDFFTASIIFMDKNKIEISRKEILKVAESWQIPDFIELGWENTNDTFSLHGKTYNPMRNHTWTHTIKY